MNFTKTTTLSLFLLCSLIMANAFAAKIEDALFVHDKDKKLLKLMAQNPELSVDHPDEFGFELYGPKGTAQWLKDNDIAFSYLDEAHTKASSEEEFDDAGYPTYEQLTNNLKSLATKYPKIAKLFSIGKSVQGRELWVMKISDNVDVDEVEPEFKYISSMHGDEITGRELTQYLIRDMLEAYGSDSQITSLINNTEIYIMPSMNPDGSKLRRRANANGFDLNRNFPDWTKKEPNTWNRRQAETAAVMKFQAQRQFSLSANFHGGAVVVNYPWDSSYTHHPLDNLIKNLSLQYADLNPAMRNSTDFNRGITNGAQWYVLYGGMQDWSYYWHNDLQVTVELSNAKWPRYSEIPSFYADNKDSMLHYATLVHQGAGFKFNSNKSGLVEIIALTNGESSLGKFPFHAGEFYKVLPKGNYRFKVTSANENLEFETTVSDKIDTNGNYHQL